MTSPHDIHKLVARSEDAWRVYIARETFEPGDNDELIPGHGRPRFAVHLLRRVQPPSIDAGAYESAGHRAGVLAVLE